MHDKQKKLLAVIMPLVVREVGDVSLSLVIGKTIRLNTNTASYEIIARDSDNQQGCLFICNIVADWVRYRKPVSEVAELKAIAGILADTLTDVTRDAVLHHFDYAYSLLHDRNRCKVRTL